jgi:hypothetical protein
MQIQSASIPASATPAKPASPNKHQPQAEAAQVKPNAAADSKPDARTVSQDRTETASNTQFAPVSAPTASTASNASFGANRDGVSASKPINQYQQMAQQGLSNEKNAHSDLFGVDVYV